VPHCRRHSSGQTLYEIAVYGEKPYSEWTNARVWVEVQSGYVLPPPKGCHPQLYDVMRSCWAKVIDGGRHAFLR
jgi:hypothetical protein